MLINDGVNDSIAVDAEACEIKPTWNAAVCKGDVGRLNFGGGGGGFGARGGGAPRAGAAGPGGSGRTLRRCSRGRLGAGPGAGPGAVRVLVGLARLRLVPVVLAHLVVEPAVPVEPLLSRQSFSAAMARSSP